MYVYKSSKVRGARKMGCFGIDKIMLHVVSLGILCVLLVSVHGQPSTKGFISIDCGLSNTSNFIDPTTGLSYSSDDKFADTGISYEIASSYKSSSLSEVDFTLRSFPNGSRNCYTLKPVVQYTNYLVRATFLYGDYDGQNSANSELKFDLYIGVDYWETVTISDASSVYVAEIYTVTVANFLWVCLVNTGNGIPFINALELRPLQNDLYNIYLNETSALVLHSRINFGGNAIVRYPDDPNDRTWTPFSFGTQWTTISTTSTVSYSSNDIFQVPSVVLQTALTPVNSSAMGLRWNSSSTDSFIFSLHFAELLALPANTSRAFDILINGIVVLEGLVPTFLIDNGVYTDTAIGGLSSYLIRLNQTSNSTLPPIINAFEAYTTLSLSQELTNLNDVGAMMVLKAEYGLNKNWEGDPCSPQTYSWDGLSCDYSSLAPRITSLDLSNSNLTGAISDSLKNLSSLLFLDLSYNSLTGEIPTSLGLLLSLEFLDLSYNNLTGAIPDSLGNLQSLKVLNLTGNHFDGPVPPSLLERSEEGLLILRIDTQISTPGTSSSKLSMRVIIIIAVAAAVFLLLIILVVFLVIWRIGRKKHRAVNTTIPVSRPPAQGHYPTMPVRQPIGENIHQIAEQHRHPTRGDSKEFSYQQLANITNNFARVIGKGKFGYVYHGYLENGCQVAVKLHSNSGAQHIQAFVTEAQNLTKVHHRNLVPLVGYCADGNYTALVYEYMSQGSLKEHLRGKGGLPRSLTWQERLRIAVEAAEGLDYLHRGCMPAVIHKDVKSSTILLGENLETKITDFSLPNSFLSTEQTEMVANGTPGYIDPEFHRTYQLNEKSDVYSFGVVLLELITGQPVIQQGRSMVHIVQWVGAGIRNENFDDIVDRKLEKEFDAQSVSKVLDLALKCTEKFSRRRPTMSDVVIQLKESLKLENAQEYQQSSNFGTSFEIDGR